MTEQKLQLLFRMQRDQNAAPTESCPDQEAIAALVGSRAHNGDRAELRAHIADCPHCAARFAIVLESSADDSNPGHRNQYLGIAAALAIVAVSIVWFRPDDSLLPGENVELRNVKQLQNAPALTFPTEGQTVDRSNMTVQWTPVSDAMHYSIRIVDGYGRIIDQAITDAPEYTVPLNLRLAPDTTYYVRVDAYLVGDKAVSSSHIDFRVAE